MRKIQLSLLLSIVVLATGCPKYKPSKVELDNPQSFTTKLNLYFKAKQTEYINALGSVPDGAEKAKRIRNQFIEDVLPFIDEVYMNFITDIQAGRDRSNFVADLIELGTSAAVGITNGERPLQILGIGLTAFRGGRRSADLNFYKEQSTPILINKMDDNRAKVRAMILDREKSSVEDYPIGTAIGDIVAYYNAGTLVRAFTELSKDTAAQAQESERIVREKLTGPIIGETTQADRDLSKEAADTLRRLRNELADDSSKDDATRKLQQIVGALEEDPDIKAVLVAAGASQTDTDGEKLRTALITIRRSASQANNEKMLKKINQSIVDLGQ